jgi:hypothetical protein
MINVTKNYLPDVNKSFELLYTNNLNNNVFE